MIGFKNLSGKSREVTLPIDFLEKKKINDQNEDSKNVELLVS